MFKEILSVWREESFLSEILRDFDAMLKLDLWMLEEAVNSLKDKEKAKSIKDELYGEDKSVNKKEQDIRKRLVEHLSINPREDFVACLVFMSIVKDAERIGDYAKNIYELNSIIKTDIDDDFGMLLLSLVEKVKSDLNEVITAFDESDTEKAKEIMIRHKDISSNVESFLRALALRKDFSPDKIVGYTLFLRYIKRISSHTANIASAVVNPLEKIDFAIEGELKNS